MRSDAHKKAMRFRITTWTLLLAASAVLILLPGLVVAMDLFRAEGLRRDSLDAADSRTRIEGILASLGEAESDQRAYIITGRHTRLDGYARARDQALRSIAIQGASAPVGPNGRASVLALQTDVTRKFVDMGREIELHDRLGLAAAAAAVASDTDVLDMQRIRTRVSGLLDEACQILADRRAEAVKLRVQRLAFSVLLAAGLAGFAGVAVWTQWTRTRERQRLLEVAGEAGVRFEAILDSAMDAVVSLSPTGAIETANAAAVGMFGYSREEMLLRDFSLLIRTTPARREAFLRRIATQGVQADRGVLSLVGQHKDGSILPLDVALGAMTLADGMHVTAIMRDVSERRRLEEMKDEFISTVSHELRTPLTSIAGALGLLKGGAGGQMSERATRLIQLAESNSARLVRLVNDILDIEKIESGKVSFSFKPLHLCDLVRSSVDGMAGLAEDRGVRLKLREPLVDLGALGDEDRLMQVLANLLSNALKFSPRTSEVEIWIERLADRARVCIQDQGPGIPEGLRARIFEKFGQGGSAEGRHDGTGLGLPIAREIVRRHGGRLDFETPATQGSRFWFELPLYDLGQAVDAEPEKRLLICEDDPLAAEFLANDLEARGWRCDTVATAAEAERALQSCRYATLLLDMRLPDASGLSLLRSLRGAPNTRRLPVIVVSGSLEGRVEAAELQITDWLDKPVNLARLGRAVQTALIQTVGPAPCILHVDDDRDILEVTRCLLGAVGEITSASSLVAARLVLDGTTPDLVILDMDLPDGSGAELLDELVDAQGRPLPVIVYSARAPRPEVAERVPAVLLKSPSTLPSLVRLVRRMLDCPANDDESAPWVEMSA